MQENACERPPKGPVNVLAVLRIAVPIHDLIEIVDDVALSLKVPCRAVPNRTARHSMLSSASFGRSLFLAMSRACKPLSPAHSRISRLHVPGLPLLTPSRPQHPHAIPNRPSLRRKLRVTGGEFAIEFYRQRQIDAVFQRMAEVDCQIARICNVTG